MPSSTIYGSIVGGKDEDMKSKGIVSITSDDETSRLLLKDTSTKHNHHSNFVLKNGSGWWSFLLFQWFTPILHRGNEKKKLNPEDLDLVPLPEDCLSGPITQQFERFWHTELRNNPSNPSLLKVLFHAFGKEFLQAGMLKIVHDLCTFVGPQVLRHMILYLRQPVDNSSSGSIVGSVWHGLILTAVVTFSQIAMSLCLRHYFFKCYKTGLRVRTAVITAVYKKALILSAGERQNRTLGEITNLMSVDAERLEELSSWLHSIWSSPLQIALALFFLWRELGASSLGGVAVIVIMIPVSQKLSAWMWTIQEKLMGLKDRRVEVNSEVLSNMKIIKFQAWEEAFQKRILSLRDIELNQLFLYFLGSSFSEGLWVFTPLVVSIATFGAYVWSGHTLDVASALTSLALFDILRFPLFMLPMIINSIVQAAVSLKRVLSFLQCNEYSPVGEGSLLNVGIQITGVSAAYDSKRPKVEGDANQDIVKELAEKEWELTLLRSQLEDAEYEIKIRSKNNLSSHTCDEVNSTSPLCLRRINFECRPGQFIAVVGAVGSGKTTFLNTILGEVRQVSGITAVKGKLAYFSQIPFIMNASLRDNILFGHTGEPVDEVLYQRCLDCCALRHDLESLPDKDQTEIGERGITLSGGQKARLALARAVYHRGDITLIDDALSAVDAHVAKHLFENALVGELMTPIDTKRVRSVVLVTNALQYVADPRIDKIVVVQDGRIVEEGTYSDLTSKVDSAFARMVSQIEKSGVSSSAFGNLAHQTVDGSKSDDCSTAKKVESVKISHTESSKLMTEEVRETGRVDLQVYMTWIKAAGGVIVPIVSLTTFVCFEVASVLSNWWLTYWSAHGSLGHSQTYFLAVYAAINGTAAVADFFRGFVLAVFSLRASRKLFSQMLESILHAKMSFFDTTPVGRLVNRFSNDMDTVDEGIIYTLINYIATLFNVISSVVVISLVTPVFAITLIPMIMFYLKEQAFFTLSYRELKRLDSVARSPIYALLGESIDGAAVIRAFAAHKSLFMRLLHMLDDQQHAYFLSCTGQSWLAIRLELIGTLVITCACLSSILHRVIGGSSSVSAGLSGLAISYALSITQSLNWTVRMASDMEANMVSVERIGEFIKIENEGERKAKSDSELSNPWPSHGEIVFQDVQLRYRPELPLVLKGLNLKIPAGSKVGVVGRTGAGKSTLMVSLMRIVELSGGSILIDGTDIRTIGLAKLRGNIAVIPQDPVLFSGTIRTNLDPFEEYGDGELYEVLEHVGLYKSLVASNTSSNSLVGLGNTRVDTIEDKVAEGGINFSVGQRQLIVIARALLHGAKIVIMDEATAAVDAETDGAIQKVLRHEFASSTCITVAHRLNTVMDSDFILVMDNGRAAEFDTPKNLLEKDSLFRDLVKATVSD